MGHITHQLIAEPYHQCPLPLQCSDWLGWRWYKSCILRQHLAVIHMFAIIVCVCFASLPAPLGRLSFQGMTALQHTSTLT